MPTLLDSSNTSTSDHEHSRPSGPRLPSGWLEHKADLAAQRLRVPAKLAAQRIGLSDQRCVELSAQIAPIKHALTNRTWATPQQGEQLAQRLMHLEARLHDERVALWRDLASLMTQARDAAVEAQRASWLEEFMRQVGPRDAYRGGQA